MCDNCDQCKRQKRLFTGDVIDKVEVLSDIKNSMVNVRTIIMMKKEIERLTIELSKSRSKNKKDQLEDSIEQIEADILIIEEDIKSILEGYE